MCEIHFHCDKKKAIEILLTISFQLKLISDAIALMKEVQEFWEEMLFNNWHRLKVRILLVMLIGGTLYQKSTEEFDTSSRPEKQEEILRCCHTHRVGWTEGYCQKSEEFHKNNSRNVVQKLRVAVWGSHHLSPTHNACGCFGLLIHTASECDICLLWPVTKLVDFVVTFHCPIMF